jgi:hypothetical protein
MKFNPVKTLLGGLALAVALHLPNADAAVRVYGTAQSSGETVTVQLLADIEPTPIVSFSVKLFYNPEALQAGRAFQDETVWQMHDGDSPVPYAGPNAATPGEIVFVGAKFSADNPLAGVAGTAVPLGYATFRRLNPDRADFDISLGHQGNFASFVSVKGVVLDVLPGEVLWSSIQPDANDQDLDGLSDRWEEEFFKDISLAYYSDDFDRDGLTNQEEAAMGSNPTEPNAQLQVRLVRDGRGMRLEWNSIADRLYAVETAKGLGLTFEALEQDIPATPPVNIYELKVGEDAAFFRVRLQADGGRYVASCVPARVGAMVMGGERSLSKL